MLKLHLKPQMTPKLNKFFQIWATFCPFLPLFDLFFDTFDPYFLNICAVSGNEEVVTLWSPKMNQKCFKSVSHHKKWCLALFWALGTSSHPLRNHFWFYVNMGVATMYEAKRGVLGSKKSKNFCSQKASK